MHVGAGPAILSWRSSLVSWVRGKKRNGTTPNLWSSVESSYLLLDTASKNVETVVVGHTRVAFSHFWLDWEVKRNILKSVTVDSVKSFAWRPVVVASEDHELAVMYDWGVPPSLGGMVLFLGVYIPFKLLKLPALSSTLHPSFFENLLCSSHFLPIFLLQKVVNPSTPFFLKPYNHLFFLAAKTSSAQKRFENFQQTRFWLTRTDRPLFFIILIPAFLFWLALFLITSEQS